MTITITAGEGRNSLVSFEQPRVVLVEGSDDQAIILGLLRHESLDDFHIHNMIGKDSWTGKLKAICRVRGFGRVAALGLVRDADSNGQAAWDSCRSTLNAAHLPIPGTPGLLQPGRPSVAVAIVPEVDDTGAIEKLCLPSFASTNMACLASYFNCLGYSSDPPHKAIVQAYLAGLTPSCKDLSVAVRGGALDFAHQTFDHLRTFLRELHSA
jgi:hypothetical protein